MQSSGRTSHTNREVPHKYAPEQSVGPTEFFFNDTFSKNELAELKNECNEEEAEENVKSEDEQEEDIGNEVTPAIVPNVLQLHRYFNRVFSSEFLIQL